MLVLAGAAACGLLAGVLAALCWLRIMPPGSNKSYWSGFNDRVRRLIGTPDDGEFLRLYKDLLRSAGAFVGRNLLALVVSVAPVGALVYFTLFPLERHAAIAADRVEAYARQPVAFADTGDRQRPWGRNAAGSVPRLTLEGQDIEVPGLEAGTAICAGFGDCLAMALLGLDVIERADLSGVLDGPVIVRPLFAHASPLWPWLSDVSVAFYVALLAGALLVPLARSRRD